MKKPLVSIIMLLTLNSFSQGNLGNALHSLSSTIASKIIKINKKRIAVIDLTDINKSETSAGKYIADVLSIELLNYDENFQLYDRQNLDKIMKEIKLSEEGYIDETTAKRLGRMLSVDAIVSGNYTVFSDHISITLKVFDTETAFLIGGAIKNIELDSDAKSLLGLASSGSRGFNSPIPTNEVFNNPSTVDNGCNTSNTGDYCFTNSTNVEIIIGIFNQGQSTNYEWDAKKKLKMQPGETKCLYDLNAEVKVYAAYGQVYKSNSNWVVMSEGEIRIEKCKSKSLTISGTYVSHK